MSGSYVPFREWVEYLDIREGDVLLVSSDIQRAALTACRNKENFSPDLLIESFQKKLTSKGTLMFPTFNWDFCKGLPFDYRSTPCMTGALGRAALGRDDFRRSLHPIYSFAVWGHDRDYVCEMRNAGSFGEDSPFAYLHQKGRSLMIDVSMRNCFTFAHYVEERMAVPYRYMKTFTTLYKGPDGREETRSYSMYVRYLDKNVVTLIDPIGDDMMKTGKLKRKIINDVQLSTLTFADFYEAAEKDIAENHARKLCRYDGQP